MKTSKSTNSKLYEIIHSRASNAEEDENLHERERKARQRLQRSSLYGGGARTKIPKTKKGVSGLGKSSHRVGHQNFSNNQNVYKKNLDSSVPPSAHSDQFRLVTNNTRIAMQDPDRVFYNTSSMQEGLHHVSQPPWFFGNANKIKPSDGDLILAANRYGYRGAQNIKQYSTDIRGDPSKTRTAYTPEFLNNGDEIINEYVPPIVACVHQTVNALETPKLWPENTSYVTGFKKKEDPSSWAYRTQTTVDSSERPFTSDSLDRSVDIARQKADLLFQCSQLESSARLSSRPIEKQQQFASDWNLKVYKDANNTLRSHLNREHVTREAHTLLDPSDRLHYSGSTAIIIHSQTTEELKFRNRMEQSKSKSITPFMKRWSHVIHHFKEVQNKLKRKDTMEEVLELLGQELLEKAKMGGSETTITRVDFIATLKKNHYSEEVSSKQLSSLYSSFDPMRRNSVRFVEVLACLKLLDNAEQTALEKIKTLWLTNMKYGCDRNVLTLALDCLTTGCQSMDEVNAIEHYFYSNFKPAAYSEALRYNKPPRVRATSAGPRMSSPTPTPTKGEKWAQQSDQAGRALGGKSGLPPRPASSTGTSPGPQQSQTHTDMEGQPSMRSGSASTSRFNAAIQPQYNICEQYLDEDTFVGVLRRKECAKIVELFDSQLSKKLSMIYGTDPRIKVDNDEDERIQAAINNFQWILGAQATKVKTFSTGFRPPPSAPPKTST